MKDARRLPRLPREATADRAPERGARVLPFPDTLPDDTALLRMLVEGDARAPRAVWQRFFSLVHRLLQRAFGPDHDVDDLVQEVFLVLFRRASTIREAKALPAYVLSITAHTIRREIRRKRALSWLQLAPAAIARAKDADLDAREAVKRLYRMLDRLGANERTAFVLRFVEGLPVDELARALDVSPATAKRRASRAWNRVVVWSERDAALVEYLAALPAEGAP
ncbi:MAG: sigma-70 family RNA polymerase sigma factor [Myxococcales bacterium]|nr:sigma-70 family RNA polymerase sigma factor [Myxococcales bacterium]